MTSKTLYKALSVLVLSSALSGCQLLTGCEEGAGPVVEKILVLDGFTGIAVEGSLDVVVHNEGEPGVRLEGQANMIELITAEVKKGVLEVSTEKCYNTNKKLIVHVTQPSMSLMRVVGSGNITGDGVLRATELTLEVEGSGDVQLDVAVIGLAALVEGSGDITVSGECSKLKAAVTGSGDISAYDLRASDATAEVTGSGDIRVNVVNNLEAEVTGSGDINFKGDPILTKNISGSGDVKHQ